MTRLPFADLIAERAEAKRDQAVQSDDCRGDAGAVSDDPVAGVHEQAAAEERAGDDRREGRCRRSVVHQGAREPAAEHSEEVGGLSLTDCGAMLIRARFLGCRQTT